MELSDLDKSKLSEAIELQKRDEDHKALSILQYLFKKNPEDHRINGVLGLILGGKLEKRKEAIPYLKFATSKSNYEHFHLCLYICYAEIEDYDKAFNVLFNYLEKNAAKLFKDTLIELMEGLVEGYGTNYKEKIIHYSKKNGIEILKELI